MFKDIRYRYDSRRATMDVGSYTVHQLRLLGGGSGSSVHMPVSGHRRSIAGCKPTQWPEGHTGRMTCARGRARREAVDAGVGSEASCAFNQTGPQFFHRLP
jgi:hypothetical protein